MQTLGQRIYKLRTSKKLSRDALGDKVGASKTAIKNWEDGENVPKLEYIQKLADFFSCSVEYLTDGRIDGDNFKNAPMDEVTMVPVLNHVQAGAFCEYFEDAVADRTEPIVGNDYNKNIYWLIIEGLSMAPEFNPKDLILVDPDTQPNPGDYVVAIKDGEHEVTFKKWRPRGFDENGVEYFELVPLNPDFPTIDSRHAPFGICGVMIEHRKKYR